MPTQDNSNQYGLNLARSLINGLRQGLSTSGVTHVYQHSQEALGYNTLAIAILACTFQEAAFLFIHTNNVPKTRKGQYLRSMSEEASKEAFAFINGTGFELMIKYYHLDYDADRLREAFYEKFHIRETI